MYAIENEIDLLFFSSTPKASNPRQPNNPWGLLCLLLTLHIDADASACCLLFEILNFYSDIRPGCLDVL